MKKLLSLLTAIMLLFTFTACEKDTSSASYTVGLLQLVEHPSLDEIRGAIMMSWQRKVMRILSILIMLTVKMMAAQ